jgi:hypothetical protein
MGEDVTNHPDAPGVERLTDLVVEPVPRAEIERRRADGEVLVEHGVRERDDVDAEVRLDRTAGGRRLDQDVGTYLYRFVQLFGTPQFPEYAAGEDVSWREDETFKYLLRVDAGGADAADDLPPEWLMTVYDYRVSLGVAVAEWCDSEREATPPGAAVSLASLALARNVGGEPVACEYEGVWY